MVGLLRVYYHSFYLGGTLRRAQAQYLLWCDVGVIRARLLSELSVKELNSAHTLSLAGAADVRRYGLK